MRKAVAIGILLTLVVAVFATALMKANAPSTDRITPAKGKVGHTAIIHGEGFKAGPIAVKFGSTSATNIEAPNNKTVKVTIPNRNALDPNPVRVTVTVDGEPATGDLWFTYDPIGPEPLITSFSPSSAEVAVPIMLAIQGTDFTTHQGRMPNQIFLVGPELIEGTVNAGATATSFTAKFSAASLKGVYLIIVGFSDGSGTTATGFEVL